MEGLWYRRLNPLRWSERAIRVFVTGFFLIMVPVYLYIGFQPVASIEALSYPTLDFPALKLSTPVAALELTDHQLVAPSTIAGSYSRSENKIFIIGHSSTVFKKLDQATLDMDFIYNNVKYRIVNIETLEKSAINMQEILAPAELPTIIIMTCAGEPLPNQDATHRLIITANAI